MSEFMQRQVLFGLWVQVDTEIGTEILDADVMLNTHRVKEGDVIPFEDIKDYCEGKTPESDVEIVRGYGARLSAPGYMDCTSWTFFEEKKDAEDHLDDMYGEEA